jgi:hypothetical protein
MVATVVSERLATLRELNDYYTLEEMYGLYEIIHVKRYNEIAYSRWASSRRDKKGKEKMRFVR